MTATALDRDEGLNGTVRYSLEPDVALRYPGVFSLNPNTGRISTLRTLDREERAEYTLVLRAHDQVSGSITSA